MKKRKIPFLTWFGVGFAGMSAINGNSDAALCGVLIILIALVSWEIKEAANHQREKAKENNGA